MLAAIAIVALGALVIATARVLGLLRFRGTVTPIALFLVFELLVTWPSLIGGSRDSAEIGLSLLLGALAVVPLLVGYTLARSLSPSIPEAFHTRPRSLNQRDRIQLCALLAVAVLVSFILYRGIPPVWRTITELGISDSGRAELSIQRKLLTKGANFGTAEYRGQGLLSVIQLCTWVLVAARLGLLTAGVLRRSTIFVILLLGSLLVGGVGERASIVLVVAAFTIARIGSSGLGAGRAARRYAPILVVVLIAVGSFSGQAIGISSPADYAGRLASRLFLGNGTNTVDIIEYRHSGELQAAKGSIVLEQVRAALPGVSKNAVPFSNRLARVQGSRSQTTYSTPTNLGLMYADWGWLGVHALYFALGAAFAVLERLLRRAQRTSEGFGLASGVAIALWAGYTSLTGITGCMVNLAVTVSLFGATRLGASLLSRDAQLSPSFAGPPRQRAGPARRTVD